jgi:hypothetical protein
LFGREHLEAKLTESWSAGLPASVTSRASFWASRLCSFPITATESYAYDAATDTASITESIKYTTVCGGGTKYAPIPPMLGLAKDPLQVQFSAPIVDGNLPTEFGPSLGIENTDAYTWSITGLGKYADRTRSATGSGVVPEELQRDLNAQVDKIVQAGHLAPWVFNDRLPRPGGDIYWMNPADTLFLLAEVIPALSDPQRTHLLTYLRQERVKYPPETVANLDLTQGMVRGDYSIDPFTSVDVFKKVRPELWAKAVPLYSFLGLSRYYDVTGETVPSSVVESAKAALDVSMREQDWATLHWFRGHGDRRVAVVNANRHFAGLVGLAKLSKRAGDASTEGLARTLLAKAAVSRVGMAHYPRYLESAKLLELPLDAGADWQVRFSAGRWQGFVFLHSWTTADDDPRQVADLNQFGTYLYDSSGFGDWDVGPVAAHLVAYRDMVPELAELLSDFAAPEATIYLQKAIDYSPHWYAAFAEGVLGQEHNVSHPIDSYQLFMAMAWLQQPTPQELARYADIPWLATGDLFYVHKLAEAVKAYRGVTWQEG